LTRFEPVFVSLSARLAVEELTPEDDDGRYDEEDAEDTEAETIDNHRHQLPLTTHLLHLSIFLHLARQLPQLGQYSQLH